MKTIRILFVLLLVAFSYQQADAYTCKVPEHSSTMQGCINAVSDGDTVLVGRGTYYEHIDFLGKKILVASKFIEDSSQTTIDSTIIDGGSYGSVVIFGYDEDTSSIICGFTIRNGGNVLWGGGIYCVEGTSPSIVSNVIKENSVLHHGGGIYCGSYCSPRILGNTITQNHAGREGGGIRIGPHSNPFISGNIINYNTTPEFEEHGSGGGIDLRDGCAGTVENNDISHNRSGAGGGIHFTGFCATKLLNNVISHNVAGWGGGIYTVYPRLEIINNTFDSDSGRVKGGAIYLWNLGSPLIKNNIISNTLSKCGIYAEMSTPVVTYNCFWNNLDSNSYGLHPLVGDTSWDENFNGTPCDSFYNIIVEPLFDPESTNYALLCSSECIDAGDTDFPPLAVGGAKIDQGAFEYPYILGDATGNDTIDVGDIMFLIGCVFLGDECPCPWRAGDAHCDGILNSGDIVRLIGYVFLGESPPDCQDCKSGGMKPEISFQSLKTTQDLSWVGFAPPAELSDGLVELSITGGFDTEILAVDLEIECDPDEIELLNPELADMTEHLQIYYGFKDGVLRIGVFDIHGKHSIAPSQGTIVTLRLKGTDPSSLKISKATLLGRNAQKIPVQVVSQVKNPMRDLMATKPAVPEEFSLSQNYPNPFNPETEISYDLPKDSWVRLSIYNIRGQKVKTLVDGFEAAGHKRVTWNGKSQDGDQVASGVYFYRLEAAEFTAIKKMVLLR